MFLQQSSVRVRSKCCFFWRVYNYVCFSIFNIARKGISIKHINNACTNSIIMWHFHGFCLVQNTGGGTLKLYWTDVIWLHQDCVLHLDKTEKNSFLLYRDICWAFIRNICVDDIFSTMYQELLPVVGKLRYTWPTLLLEPYCSEDGHLCLPFHARAKSPCFCRKVGELSWSNFPLHTMKMCLRREFPYIFQYTPIL